MTRVLIGDALVNENDRLQTRINQLLDRVEATLRQLLRIAEAQHQVQVDPADAANLLLCFVVGRWHMYAKSGFKRLPMHQFTQQWLLLIHPWVIEAPQLFSTQS